MIKLSPAALAAAQVDHFASPPTHAKVFRVNKANVDPSDHDLKAIAPELKPVLEGTYAYGTIVDGAFVRTPRTPLVHVLLDVGQPYASDTVQLKPAPHTQGPDRQAAETRRNRAALAADHLVAAGRAPNHAQPWMHDVVAAKAAWEFRETDFDAVAAISDARLDGTVA